MLFRKKKKYFLGNYFAQQGFSFFKMIKQKQDLNDFSECNNVVFLLFSLFLFFISNNIVTATSRLISVIMQKCNTEKIIGYFHR